MYLLNPLVSRFRRDCGRPLASLPGPAADGGEKAVDQLTKNPQASDLGVSHGAGDENRTRALSLGS